jgi:hypothetical protein
MSLETTETLAPGAGGGRASAVSRGSAMTDTPAPTERDDAPVVVAADRARGGAPETVNRLAPGQPPQPAGDGGETTAKLCPRESASSPVPSPHHSPHGARAANRRAAETLRLDPPRATDDPDAVVVEDGGRFRSAGNCQVVNAAVHPLDASPLIVEIVNKWRERQAMVRARQRLILQAKALCRRMTDGDKVAADRLHSAAARGDDIDAMLILEPFFEGAAPFTRRINQLDRHLEKLAARLPVADTARAVRGFGLGGLAKTVGELGDLSAYTKAEAGVWKRAGLAVIDGGRQRRVSGDAALVHGYAPERRSVFWNIAEAMLKGQGKDDAAGPYRRIYDARKALERPRVASDAHAHARAMRFMTKRLLRDLTRAWRAISPQ